MTRVNKMWLGLLGLAVSSSVIATDGPYLTLGGGWMGMNKGKISTNSTDLTNDGLYSYPTFRRGNQTGYRVGLGTMIDNNLGAEVGYSWFGRKTSEVVNGANDVILKSSGGSFDVSGVGKTSLGDAVSAYLKLGVAYTQIRRGFNNSTGLAVSPWAARSTNAFGVYGGLGLEYDFTKVVGLRVEAAGVAGRASNYQVTGNVVLHFG